MNDRDLKRLETVQKRLMEAVSLEKKREILLTLPQVTQALQANEYQTLFATIQKRASLLEEVAFLSIFAVGEEKTLLAEREGFFQRMEALAEVERFYAEKGGVVGYMAIVSQFLHDKHPAPKKSYQRPPLFDITSPTPEVKKSVLQGIMGLRKLAEIYPVGGLGDRLHLRSASGEPLPSATLPFCGKSLLEGLVRDVQGREYLYYKLFKKKVVVPIALMTSQENDNDAHILALCEENHWFFRSSQSFFLFSQPSVPVITYEGHFSMKSSRELNCQPGGHGALWKTAEEKGVYRWLQGQKKEVVLIRQINNPIAGIDHGLLALVGKGILEKKTLGFASCKRLMGAAEGVLVVRENGNGEKTISNIEYTDFARLGIIDTQDEQGYSLFPTNTNILFADLTKLVELIVKNPLPGVVLNMKSDVPALSEEGEVKKIKGGRLESMMQSLSDALPANDVYLTYNERLKTISTTKKAYEEEKGLLETPPGAFVDLMENGCQLLRSCGVDLPNDPALIFFYHPALGPLYEIIRQKVRGGTIAPCSELELEIAEVLLENFHLDGSVAIEAKQVMGVHMDEILDYSEEVGRVVLKNVTVRNRGIDRSNNPSYWNKQYRHHERLHILLEGCSEFHAENVVFEGNLEIKVPHGERWTAIQEGGKVGFKKEAIDAPTWHWDYQVDDEGVKLMLHDLRSHVV